MTAGYIILGILVGFVLGVISRGRCCGSWSAGTREKKNGKALFAIEPVSVQATRPA